jgi:hypothetical protein
MNQDTGEQPWHSIGEVALPASTASEDYSSNGAIASGSTVYVEKDTVKMVTRPRL